MENWPLMDFRKKWQNFRLMSFLFWSFFYKGEKYLLIFDCSVKFCMFLTSKTLHIKNFIGNHWVITEIREWPFLHDLREISGAKKGPPLYNWYEAKVSYITLKISSKLLLYPQIGRYKSTASQIYKIILQIIKPQKCGLFFFLYVLVFGGFCVSENSSGFAKRILRRHVRFGSRLSCRNFGRFTLLTSHAWCFRWVFFEIST